MGPAGLACATPGGILEHDTCLPASPMSDPILLLEQARRDLGFTYSELACIISADESTLHRWRSGTSRPSAAYAVRLAALRDLLAALAASSPEGVPAWLDQPVPSLDGRTPRDLLLRGRPDLLTGVLRERALATAPPVVSAAVP